MKILSRSVCASLVLVSILGSCFGSAYNARPKLAVIIIIDQFRGDYLERYHDRFGEGGFRLFLDHGANFTHCNYDYANTRTAPGHATLLSGTYTSGHGIIANEWWDPQKKKMVTSVEDDGTKLVGIASEEPGASPHNLLADTLGDELRLATQGKSRVYGIALKDRAAVLPAGFSGKAYWIDHQSGAWITSTYYGQELPKWVQDFNSSKRADKYWNREWKTEDGKVLRTTEPRAAKNGAPAGFYEVVGSTPLANDYELEFAKELAVYEKLGNGPATDLLVISLSANDILGHQVGPDSPEMEAMALALDHQLADFVTFLGHQLGLANVWLALSADHGVSPLPSVAQGLHIPAANLDNPKAQLNAALSAKLSPGRTTEYIRSFDYPLAWLNEEAFASMKEDEKTAERDAGEAMLQIGLRGFYTRSQLADGDAPATELGRQFLHSYSPQGGWYVMGVPPPFTVGTSGGTDHASPYTYDTHVPLAFYGLPFQPGEYREHAEPVDLAVTLAALLGINAPTHAIGRVLTEALSEHHTTGNPNRPQERSAPTRPTTAPRPASFGSTQAGAQ